MTDSASRPPLPPAPVMTVPRFTAAKRQGHKLSVLTAYDYLWAGLLDAAGVDALLVGDTLGMVVQGKRTTLPVTLEHMIYHAEMVVRAVQRALVIVDMPFLSFQVSPEDALRNAGRLLKETGASAVKLEGGVNQARTIQTLVQADIPVMAHVGLKPQSVLKLGGYKMQRDVDQLLADARAVEAAGAFAVVLECIPRQAAAAITAELAIPTIGIGAGAGCDGQVLVTPDMLGLTGDSRPPFAKLFADLGTQAREAVQRYVADVQAGTFPDDRHSRD